MARPVSSGSSANGRVPREAASREAAFQSWRQRESGLLESAFGQGLLGDIPEELTDSSVLRQKAYLDALYQNPTTQRAAQVSENLGIPIRALGPTDVQGQGGRGSLGGSFYAPENQEGEAAPAPLTQLPTSTTDFSRPRTVAAGWQEDPDSVTDTGTLTVVFRDGTVYNYYRVPRTVWLGFAGSISKGRGWLNPANSHQEYDGILNGFDKGPADVSAFSPELREAVYSAARNAQIYQRNRSDKGMFTSVTKSGKRVKTRGTAPRNEKRKSPAQIQKQYAKYVPSNPNANNGKNPNQK